MTRTLDIWRGPRAERCAWWLLLAACATLFLNAAATVEIVYTLRVAYVLLAAAIAVGFPSVISGWRRFSRPIRVSAASLVAVYLLATLLGTHATVAGLGRAGGVRSYVYLVDLAVGLGTMGLIGGLVRSRERARALVGALVLGGTLAALYGLVQWPAKHYGWGIANVNNSLNPDAVSRGDVNQSSGLLLGWARVRGTFTEPFLFGLYLSSILPLTVTMLRLDRRRRRAAVVAAAVMGFCLLLTSSFPSWAIFGAAVLIGALVYFISTGDVVRSGVVALGIALAVAATALVLFGNPKIFSRVTGRSASALAFTSGSRTKAWRNSYQRWEERPVLGFGPGQSVVQLAYRQIIGARDPVSAPVVLGSSQGLVTSSLVDAGLLGLYAWIALLISIGVVSVRRLSRRPDALALGTFCAALAALGGGLVSGDRLGFHIWVLLGLTLAVARREPGEATA